jgi:hypothetical protein
LTVMIVAIILGSYLLSVAEAEDEVLGNASMR